jgi:hypothetical protein
MLKTILTRKKEIFGFTVGLGAAMLSANVMTADAAAGVTTGQSDISVVGHSHGCIKMLNSPGTIAVIDNGIRNDSTSGALKMACSLVSPEGGFDEDNDLVGADFNDQTDVAGANGAVRMRNCYTSRGATAGKGCSAYDDSSDIQDDWIGMVGITQNLVTDATEEPMQSTAPSGSDTGASRFLEVIVPKADTSSPGAPSVLRAYGFKDVGGGSLTGISSAVSTLQGQMTTANSNISTLQGQMTTANSNINSLDGRLDTVEGDIVILDGENADRIVEIGDHENRIVDLEVVVFAP